MDISDQLRHAPDWSEASVEAMVWRVVARVRGGDYLPDEADVPQWLSLMDMYDHNQKIVHDIWEILQNAPRNEDLLRRATSWAQTNRAMGRHFAMLYVFNHDPSLANYLCRKDHDNMANPRFTMVRAIVVGSKDHSAAHEILRALSETNLSGGFREEFENVARQLNF